jgi:hypothetical protein
LIVILVIRPFSELRVLVEEASHCFYISMTAVCIKLGVVIDPESKLGREKTTGDATELLHNALHNAAWT